MEYTTSTIKQNYMEIFTRWPFSRRFIYFDTPEYKADEIFRELGVAPYFEEEMSREGTPFVIIFCRIPKRSVHKFYLAMDKLVDKMLLTGFPDYLNYCNSVLSTINGAVTSASDIEEDDYESLRNCVENLRLYLKYVEQHNPELFAEMNDHFDGMPGYC